MALIYDENGNLVDDGQDEVQNTDVSQPIQQFAPAQPTFQHQSGSGPRSWFPALTQIANKYGVDPTLLHSIALQENVASRHNNPLGISPHGGGPATYQDEASAINAIDHQVGVMVNPRGPYGDIRTKNIDQIAAVYSPTGAGNDVYGTNASEASGIKQAYQKLSGVGYAPQSGFKVWGHENDAQTQQYPYDPNKDPLSGTEAFTPPAAPPPSWNDLTASQEWQGLSPEDKGKVTDQWYSQSFNYAGSLGNFQSDDRQKLYDFYQDARKQATYVDLGKAAGDTINEIGRKFKEDTLKADAGAYQHEIQTPNVSPEQVNQLIEQANSIPGLTDAQKQQNEQTIRGANQAKQEIIQKWAKDKQQEVQQTEAEKKPDAPGLATATGHLLATAVPALVGAPLGPAGMAMTGSLSQGNIGYEDGLEESSKWLAKNHPELSPEERQIKAIAAANKISDINSGFGLLMGLPGISIPKAAIPSLIPRIFAGTALNAVVGGAITGGQQYAQNQALRQTVSPEMTGEWTGVPEATAQGAALFGGTHLLHEIPGAMSNSPRIDINEARTTEQIPAATETPKTPENVPAGQPEASVGQPESQRTVSPSTEPIVEVPPIQKAPETGENDQWVSGIANRFTEERSAQGEIREIAPGEETRASTGTPVDLGTPDGLREAWLRDVGTEPTPDVQANMTQTAQRVRVAADSERIAMQNLGERIDREPISDRIPDAETVRNNILERMGIDPCLD